jgi:hypothetical protein
LEVTPVKLHVVELYVVEFHSARSNRYELLERGFLEEGVAANLVRHMDEYKDRDQKSQEIRSTLQGCQIFIWYNIPKQEKIYPNRKNRPNVRKIDQMSAK